MKQSGWFGVVAICLAFVGQILAYTDAHGPFDNGANVKRISLEVMERSGGVGIEIPPYGVEEANSLPHPSDVPARPLPAGRCRHFLRNGSYERALVETVSKR